jgi:hypothetical protein
MCLLPSFYHHRLIILMLSLQKSFVTFSSKYRLGPKSRRVIAYLLTWMKIKSKSKKVGDCSQSSVRKEKSLISAKTRSSGAIIKIYATVQLKIFGLSTHPRDLGRYCVLVVVCWESPVLSPCGRGVSCFLGSLPFLLVPILPFFTN